jgi:hypothetical protein
MLVVDGGSKTYGDGLDDIKDAWPYILNSNVINIALKGKSPERIEADILNYYYTTNKFSHCIIAWPNINRRCVYNATNRLYIDYNSHGLFHSEYTDNQFVNKIYKKYHCNTEQLKQHWLRCLRLIGWFKSKNIIWMMINQDYIEQQIINVLKSNDVDRKRIVLPGFDNTNDEQIKNIIFELDILQTEIEQHENYRLFNKYSMPGPGHPSKQEHEKIAKVIKKEWYLVCS